MTAAGVAFLSPHPRPPETTDAGISKASRGWGAGLTGAARGGARGPGAKAPEELGLLDVVLAVCGALDRVLVPHTRVGLLEQQLRGGQRSGGGCRTCTPAAAQDHFINEVSKRLKQQRSAGAAPAPSAGLGAVSGNHDKQQ